MVYSGNYTNGYHYNHYAMPNIIHTDIHDSTIILNSTRFLPIILHPHFHICRIIFQLNSKIVSCNISNISPYLSYHISIQQHISIQYYFIDISIFVLSYINLTSINIIFYNITYTSTSRPSHYYSTLRISQIILHTHLHIFPTIYLIEYLDIFL